LTTEGSSHGDPSDVSTSQAPRPKGIKGFVYDYIKDRLDAPHHELEWILTSDVWYDLVKDPKVEEYYKSQTWFFYKKSRSNKAAHERNHSGQIHQRHM
jgi:hypothetical protein